MILDQTVVVAAGFEQVCAVITQLLQLLSALL